MQTMTDKDKRTPSDKHFIDSINQRFDDVVLRIDASQTSEASIHQVLNFLLNEVTDLKRQWTHQK